MLVFQSQDDIICVKINGETLGLQNGLFVCLGYAIPDNSTRQSFIHLHTFERLLDRIGLLR